MAYFQHKNEQNDPVDYLPEDRTSSRIPGKRTNTRRMSSGKMTWRRRTARNAGRDGGTKCAWRPG